jgi:hypothetical protein
MTTARKAIASALLAPMLVTGCVATIPADALIFKKDTLESRQQQTRRFDIKAEKELLSAGAGVLQDMGFNIDESETGLGVIVGSKKRDATDAGQVAGAVMLALLFGAQAAIDKEQLIRASLVTRPSENGGHMLRVTFQRVVWNSQNQVSKIEAIHDVEIYQEFFSKLSKSVFLEAQQI